MYKKFLTTILVLVSAGYIYPQEVRIYTLNEAILAAFRNNSELITARYEKLKADKKVSEVYSENLFPTISLSSQYTRAFKKPVFDIFGQKFEIGTDNSISNVLNLTEPIPVLGTPVFQGINIAKAYDKLQTENVNSIEAKVQADVKKYFYTVLFLKEVLNTAKSSLKNAEDNLAVIEKRYSNGVITDFDLLRAKVNVESTIPKILESEKNLTISKKYLKNAIGVKDDIEIDVSGELWYDSTEVLMNTDELINKIAESHVSVRQLKISQDINKELLDIDKANYLPKLYLFGQYNLQAAENDGKEIFDYRYYNVINAGIGLNWDLNIFRNSFKQKQSEIEIKKTDEKISDVKQKLKLTASAVILSIEEAQKRVIATKKTVELAEKGYDIAFKSLESGVINQIDLLDAEYTMNLSKVNYYQAILDYLKSKTELEELLEIKITNGK